MSTGKNERFPESCDQRACNRASGFGLRQTFEQHDEFVSADTRRRVDLPQLASQASGYGDEQFVTRRMAEGIVDVFEIIKIEEKYCAGTVVALGQGDRVFQAPAQKPAVRQTSE
jgi:hypothetical protein